VTAVLINAALGSSVAQATPANFTLNFATNTGTPGVGDLIVVCATIRGSTGTISTPSGWTAMTGSPFQNTASNLSRMYLFYRVRQAGDANSVSFTVSGGTTNNTLLAQAYYFGGVDPASPIEVNPVKTDQAASSTEVGPLTGVTTLAADAVAVAFWHRADDAGTFSTSSSGWVHNSATNAVVASTLGTDAAMGMATKPMPTAGASGTYTLTIAGGSSFAGMGVVLSLKAQTGSGLVTMDAEGGTDEVTPTAQASATPTIAIVVGTGLTVVDTAWAASVNGGTKSFRHDVSTTTQGRVKCNADIPSTNQYGALVGKVSARPTATVRIGSLESYDGTDLAQVQMTATGAIRLASDGAANTLGPSTTTFAADEEFRLEWRYNNGAVELRIFKGADLDNDVASPTETLSTSGWPTGTVGRGMFGNGTAWGVAASLWYDNCSVRQDNWVNLKASGTTAVAGSASITMAGQTAGKSLRPSGGLASISVTGQNAQGRTSPLAGAATLGVVGHAPTAAIRPTSQAAALSVAAQAPSAAVRPQAGLATISVSGQNSTVDVQQGTTALAGAATLGVAAQSVTAGVTVGSQAGALGVVAHAPSGLVRPTAVNAALTVSAQAPQRSIRPTAGAASASVSSQSGSGGVRPSAGAAALSMAALNASVVVGATAPAGAATISLTAHAPAVAVRPSSTAATVGVSGQNATAITSGQVTALAQAAAISMAAQAPQQSIRPSAGVATLAVTGQAPQRGIRPSAGAAVLTVSGLLPTRSIRTQATLASMTMAAQGAAVGTGTFAAAGVASIGFTAYSPKSSVMVRAGVASLAVAVTGAVASGVTAVLEYYRLVMPVRARRKMTRGGLYRYVDRVPQELSVVISGDTARTVHKPSASLDPDTVFLGGHEHVLASNDPRLAILQAAGYDLEVLP
jgi:hypothetical protein